jgi:phage tail protein X
MSRKLLLCLLFLLISATTIVFANAQPITQIDLIFDASNSMWGQIDGKAKIEIARTALNELLKEFNGKKHIYLGLRVYGHLNKRCDNSVLEIKPGANNIEPIRKKVAKIKPLGKTPIAYSLQMAAKDFDKNLPGKKIIILITDGLESCGGNPCVAAGILKKAGIITKIHVVGFGLKKKALASLDCIAKPFGGKVIGANNTKELINAFKEISKAVAIENNLRVVGLDKNRKPVLMETKVFINEKEIKKGEGTKVSFTIDKGTYKVTAKSYATGEINEQEAIEVVKEKVTEVKFIFKQGHIKLKSLDDNDSEIYAKYQFFKDEKEIAQNEGQKKVIKTLFPGKYDVKATESNTNKSLWQKNIEIQDGKTTDIAFSFAQSKMLLSATDDNNKETYTYYQVFKAGTKEEVKTSEGSGQVKIIIVPGKYDIKAFNNDTKTEIWEKDVELESGKTFEKQFKFAQGKILLSAVDSNDEKTYTYYQIFKAGTEKQVKANEGSSQVKMILPPGKYDIKATNNDTQAKVWEKGIELKGGETFEKQFKFAQGKILLSSVVSNDEKTYTYYQIFKAGTEKQAKANEGSSQVKIILPPGKYDIKATNNDTQAEIWEKGIELKGGETFKKQFKFVQGKILLSSVDKSYTYYKVFKAGTEEQVKANEGSSQVKMILLPGNYDIKVIQDATKKELWEKGIELKDGETFKKQFQF